jgi:hypothetical protein
VSERPKPFPDKKSVSGNYDKVVDHILATQKLSKEFTASQNEATWLPYGEYPDLPVSVTFLSDIHFGSIDVDYQKLSDHLHTIATTPNMFCVMVGDMIDNFNPAKHPDGMLSDAVSPQKQMQAWAEMLTFLDTHSKLGAIVWGNHEAFSRVAGLDPFSSFFKDVSCPIMADKGGGVLNTVVGGINYRMALHHVWWGTSKLNMTNAPKRLMQFGHPNIDIAVTGHSHHASGEMFVQGGEEKVAIVAGTYKVGDSFGRQWGSEPMLGGFTVTLDPNEKKVGLYRSPEEASNYIMGRIVTSWTDKDWQDPYSELINKLK